jgi:hypothetical protein
VTRDSPHSSSPAARAAVTARTGATTAGSKSSAAENTTQLATMPSLPCQRSPPLPPPPSAPLTVTKSDALAPSSPSLRVPNPRTTCLSLQCRPISRGATSAASTTALRTSTSTSPSAQSRLSSIPLFRIDIPQVLRQLLGPRRHVRARRPLEVHEQSGGGLHSRHPGVVNVYWVWRD